MSKAASKIIIAAIAGVAAGVALGILFAPRRGSKTRKKMKRTIDDLVKGNFPDIGEKLEELKTIFTREHEVKEETNKEQQ